MELYLSRQELNKVTTQAIFTGAGKVPKTVLLISFHGEMTSLAKPHNTQ